jgi:putative holliday junction resolvase
LSGLRTCLAFDFGRLKTGVAVGNSLTRGAEPLSIVRTSDSSTRLEQLSRLVEEWQPSVLVVGRPAHADGKPLPNTKACEKFARQLEARFRLPVVLIDERLSTHEANAVLRERREIAATREGQSVSKAGLRTLRHSTSSESKDDDAEAAAVILRQYWSETPD